MRLPNGIINFHVKLFIFIHFLHLEPGSFSFSISAGYMKLCSWAIIGSLAKCNYLVEIWHLKGYLSFTFTNGNK